MPKAELRRAVSVNGEIVADEGELLTGVQARRLWLHTGQRMEFRCHACLVPVTPVNIHKEKGKKAPHFRAENKLEHTYPCSFAEQPESDGSGERGGEVADDKLDVPTKLVKRPRRRPRATGPIDPPLPLPPGEGGEVIHEEHTSYWIEDLCDVYFERIRECEKPSHYGAALEGLPLRMPSSRENIGYARAFWNVARPELVSGYRIWFGSAAEVVQCRDGHLISYGIPFNNHGGWAPVVVRLSATVLGEFSWGRSIERMLSVKELSHAPWAFVCGLPERHTSGVVIPLESVFWIHCAAHPHWRNVTPRVSTSMGNMDEETQALFARRRAEHESRFPRRNPDPHEVQSPPVTGLPVAGPPVGLPPASVPQPGTLEAPADPFPDLSRSREAELPHFPAPPEVLPAGRTTLPQQPSLWQRLRTRLPWLR